MQQCELRVTGVACITQVRNSCYRHHAGMPSTNKHVDDGDDTNRISFTTIRVP